MSSADNPVLYENINAATVITINRPSRRNALSTQVISGLVAAVTKASSDPETSCLVITGAGGEAFSAGADLSDMAVARDPLSEHRGRGELARLFEALWGADKPTIARVDGYCMAGGLGLALACDIVLATPKSQFSAPEVKVGLWPYMITLPLIRSMPPKAALRLMMTGERINSEEALNFGFLTEVVQEDAMDTRIRDYSILFRDGSPQAIALGRNSFYSVVDSDPGARLQFLQASLGVALSMPDAVEGMAAFSEKRPPRWVGLSGSVDSPT